MIPLSEYKFDKNRLTIVKRNPKRKKNFVEGKERVSIEGYDKHTLWDLLVHDIAWVGIETSVVIAGMAMAGQSSSEAMAKEITHLNHLVPQL